MLTASLTLFVLSIVLPNLVILRLSSEEARKRHLAYMPNLMFALVLASFVLGVAHSAGVPDPWSVPLMVYLGFEALVLGSTLILFQMKERQKKRLLNDALAKAGSSRMPDQKSQPAANKKAGTCAPRILMDTNTQNGDTGWTVSSLFSWHIYVYKLQVRFSVSASHVEVTAEAETYDANWFELYLVGVGLLVPGAALVALIGGGSIAASHYRAVQTAKGDAICLHMDGACVLIPNADPAIPPARENEVSAAALIVATRLTPQIVQYQLTGIAIMSGHITVQGITVGGSLGVSTAIPGLPAGSPVGPTAPISLSPGINLSVQLVPSPNALHHLPLGRSVLIQCAVVESVLPPEDGGGVQPPPEDGASVPVEEEEIGSAAIWNCGEEFSLVTDGFGNTDAEAAQAAMDAAAQIAPSQCPTICGPRYVRTILTRYYDASGGRRRARSATVWKCTYQP